MKNQLISNGIIYRNPAPHVFSRHAYFPSVVVASNGELLASFAIGEAFEAANLDTFISHSVDYGETWTEPKRLLERETKKLVSNFARLTSFGDDSIAAIISQCRRDTHPEEGLANPENMGFVETDLLLVRSGDFGHSWQQPEHVEPPLIGPSFEMCSAIVELKDGRWLWPTSTWRDWNGFEPNGMKMVAFVSHDKGKTWPGFLDVMDGHHQKIIYWESKIIEMDNGLLIAIAWVYNEKEGKDLTNHYTISNNGGKTWNTPLSTGLTGQTVAISLLTDGRLFVVYRRMDKPGLWANISSIEEEQWINDESFPLWGAKELNLNSKSGNMVQDFNELKFGAPCISMLQDHTVFITFWCYEKMVSNIRWIKLSV